MADDLIHARVSAVGGSQGIRRILMRNQGDVVYDIYNIHYAYQANSPLNVDDVAMVVLSTRTDDQRNDVFTIGFDDMIVEEGLFGAVAFINDITVEGGVFAVGAHELVFPKPYTVPWLSAAFNLAVAVTTHIGVDVWFVRRRAAAMEKAALTARLGGGRARTE